MSDEDRNIFVESYKLYDRWRETEISTPAQWEQITKDFYQLVDSHQGSRLALRLAIGLMDTFDDLYGGGKKPDIPDYFGRGDI